MFNLDLIQALVCICQESTQCLVENSLVLEDICRLKREQLQRRLRGRLWVS